MWQSLQAAWSFYGVVKILSTKQNAITQHIILNKRTRHSFSDNGRRPHHRGQHAPRRPMQPQPHRLHQAPGHLPRHPQPLLQRQGPLDAPTDQPPPLVAPRAPRPAPARHHGREAAPGQVHQLPRSSPASLHGVPGEWPAGAGCGW